MLPGNFNVFSLQQLVDQACAIYRCVPRNLLFIPRLEHGNRSTGFDRGVGAVAVTAAVCADVTA